jgi:hypothetical protein
MAVPTSNVGYTSATTGRGDHEVHKGHVVALGKKYIYNYIILRGSLKRTSSSLWRPEKCNIIFLYWCLPKYHHLSYKAFGFFRLSFCLRAAWNETKSAENLWKDMARGNQNIGRNPFPIATLPTTIHTQIGPGSKPARRGKRPATNCPSHDRVFEDSKRTLSTFFSMVHILAERFLIWRCPAFGHMFFWQGRFENEDKCAAMIEWYWQGKLNYCENVSHHSVRHKTHF